MSQSVEAQEGLPQEESRNPLSRVKKALRIAGIASVGLGAAAGPGLIIYSYSNTDNARREYSQGISLARQEISGQGSTQYTTPPLMRGIFDAEVERLQEKRESDLDVARIQMLAGAGATLIVYGGIAASLSANFSKNEGANQSAYLKKSTV